MRYARSQYALGVTARRGNHQRLPLDVEDQPAQSFIQKLKRSTCEVIKQLAFLRKPLRFDLGNYNFLASAVVGASLDLLLEYGTKRIDAHVTNLSNRLAAGLQEIGAAVIRHAHSQPSNIVCVGFQGDARRAARVLDELKARQVHATVRGSMLRYSLHLYNNQDDVDMALDATRDAMNATGRTGA